MDRLNRKVADQYEICHRRSA